VTQSSKHPVVVGDVGHAALPRTSHPTRGTEHARTESWRRRGRAASLASLAPSQWPAARSWTTAAGRKRASPCRDHAPHVGFALVSDRGSKSWSTKAVLKQPRMRLFPTGWRPTVLMLILRAPKTEKRGSSEAEVGEPSKLPSRYTGTRFISRPVRLL
jgi:hypothetical protein